MSLFPSPYGDMVLKYLLRRSDPKENLIVSVPLRGYGFEIVFSLGLNKEEKVSVPLRGYGFEITYLCMYVFLDCAVSVPLRGYGFEIYGLNIAQEVSFNGFRPLAGIWF